MGGHVFGSAPIAKEDIGPTLELYYQELHLIFPKMGLKFEILGSAGKKDYSGDIDLGLELDRDCFRHLDKWNIRVEDFTTRLEKLIARARTSSQSQLRTKALLQEIAIIINAKSELIKVDVKKVNTGNMFTLFPQYGSDKHVQIDWMVGDIEWLKFAYYSSNYQDQSIKGLHRTQLLVALFQLADLNFSHTVGVKDRKGIVVANTPITALNVINSSLCLNLTIGICEDFLTLYEHLKANLDTFQFDKLIAIYFKILDSTRCEIPSIMKTLWESRKEELWLTGKFQTGEL